MSRQKFLVHLLTKKGGNKSSKPATFGYCLLDQLVEQRLLIESTNKSASLCSDDHSLNETFEIRSEKLDDTPLENDSKNCSAELCGTTEHLSHLTCSVNFSLRANALILSEVPNSDKTTAYVLRHPEFCPARLQHQQDLPPEYVGAPKSVGDSSSEKLSLQGIAVGVSMLIQSADEKVLLTRRARHMRTFPGVWVPPGGHIEVGESLVAAGARELMEETGVVLPPEQSVTVLGMWESVYPPVLGLGAPLRQHLVVYLLATISLPAHAVLMQLQAKEVEAGVWLSAEHASAVVHGSDGAHRPGLPDLIPGVVLNERGETVPGHVDTSRLRQPPVAGVADFSRLSTGSRYALSLWLEQQGSRHGCPSSPPHASL